MRLTISVLLLIAGLCGVCAQELAPDSLGPEDALSAARAVNKPVLLLWQAGPSAADFTEEYDRLWTGWPEWAARAKALVVLTRVRSWEKSLKEPFPVLGTPQVSALILGRPDGTWRVWTALPTVLELSRAIEDVAGRELEDPYTLFYDVYLQGDDCFIRENQGPYWTESSALGSRAWKEEGPRGSVLVLRSVDTGLRRALPLDGDWGFVYDEEHQTWNDDGEWTKVSTAGSDP